MIDPLALRGEQLDEIGAAVDGADADLAPDDAVGHVFSFVEPARG